MRVVAGTHRGRSLKAPKGEQTRPTSDRVREALFSILGESVAGATVLDLFAGSGALGIEALSRGAAHATFVDTANAAISVINDNLETLELEGEVVRMPALRALACTPVTSRQYDLVFIDPPYRLASALGPELSVALQTVLAPTARVVTESDRRDPLPLELPLQLERRYGDTLIRIHGPR
jgi:16S rRNA (guanine966-N2)-methyltransferase